MNSPVVYIAISIFILTAIVILMFVANKEIRKRRLTPFAGLAFAFVVAGIIFGEEQVIGYSLMVIGVAFAVADMFRKRRGE